MSPNSGRAGFSPQGLVSARFKSRRLERLVKKSGGTAAFGCAPISELQNPHRQESSATGVRLLSYCQGRIMPIGTELKRTAQHATGGGFHGSDKTFGKGNCGGIAKA